MRCSSSVRRSLRGLNRGRRKLRSCGGMVGTVGGMVSMVGVVGMIGGLVKGGAVRRRRETADGGAVRRWGAASTEGGDCTWHVVRKVRGMDGRSR